MPEHASPALAKGVVLKRNLGIIAIVGLGLGYMTPTVVFDTFGMVARDTNNVVPLAYAVALIVMLFTAISYGKMTSQFPSAGSAYTYAKEAIHPNVGFMVGWSSLLSYLLLPLVNALIVRSYLESFFPTVPAWIWVVAYVTLTTSIIYVTMRGTSNINMVLLVIALLAIATFIVITWSQLAAGAGQGTVLSVTPFIHDDVTLTAVLMGATIVCFSFIGFDALTMYVEEARTPKIVPRAIILTLLIGGGIFLVTSYFTQLRFPDWNEFAPDGNMQYVEDSALPIIGQLVGGNALAIILTAAGFAATVASGLASHASVSRMMLVMGRNDVLPRRTFGYVNPKTQTPTFNIVLAGLVCLLAIPFSLEMIAAYINFGALIAFSFVNMSVIAWFAIRQGRRRTKRDIFSFIVMPSIGLTLTGILWVNLHPDALVGGLIWAGIGLLYMVYLTKGFRQKISSFDEDQPVTGFNKVLEKVDE